MRIAPKPMPGHEIKLEDLLGKPGLTKAPEPGRYIRYVTEKYPARVGYPAGERSYWTMLGVQMNDGAYDFDLLFDTNFGNDVLTYRAQSAIEAEIAGEFRPPTAPEFFAIAQFLIHPPPGLPTQEEAQYTRARLHLHDVWNEKGIALLSIITYRPPTKLDDVAHIYEPGVKTFNAKGSEQNSEFPFLKRDISENIFQTDHTGLLNPLGNLWTSYFGQWPRFVVVAPETKPDYNRGVFVTAQAIDLKHHFMDQFTSSAILIRKRKSGQEQ